MNARIAQITAKPPPVACQAGNVTSVTPGKSLGPHDLFDNFTDATHLLPLAMVAIEELDGVCQGTASRKVLNSPSRFIDLRRSKGERRRAETPLEGQYGAGLRLLF